MKSFYSFIAFSLVSSAIALLSYNSIEPQASTNVDTQGVQPIESSALTIATDQLTRAPLDVVTESAEKISSHETSQYSADLLVESDQNANLAIRLRGYKSLDDALYNLHRLSRSQLVDLATSVSDYLPESIEAFDDIYAFTEKLLRIARNSSEDATLNEAPLYGLIAFSRAETFDMGQQWQQTEFGQLDTKIIANMPAIEDPGQNVLVSWMRQQSGEFVVFKTLAVDPSMLRNNIWIENPQGWQPGEYRVAVYSGDEHLVLLTAGSYQIL